MLSSAIGQKNVAKQIVTIFFDLNQKTWLIKVQVSLATCKMPFFSDNMSANELPEAVKNLCQGPNDWMTNDIHPDPWFK